MKIVKTKSKISIQDFKMWIETAEKLPRITLEEFNEKWEKKKQEINCRII